MALTANQRCGGTFAAAVSSTGMGLLKTAFCELELLFHME
jgi:hypothetical protein